MTALPVCWARREQILLFVNTHDLVWERTRPVFSSFSEENDRGNTSIVTVRPAENLGQLELDYHPQLSSSAVAWPWGVISSTGLPRPRALAFLRASQNRKAHHRFFVSPPPTCGTEYNKRDPLRETFGFFPVLLLGVSFTDDR